MLIVGLRVADDAEGAVFPVAKVREQRLVFLADQLLACARRQNLKVLLVLEERLLGAVVQQRLERNVHLARCHL